MRRPHLLASRGRSATSSPSGARAVALVAAAALLAPASPAAAKCARTTLVPKVLTTRAPTLPPDGGVLVGWDAEVFSGDDEPAAGDPSVQPGWRARAGTAAVALRRTTLAPGLTVYRPAGAGGAAAPAAAASTLVLEDGHGKALGTFARDPRAGKAAMKAPRVTAVALGTEREFRDERRTARATLAAAPPEEAVAVIAYRVGGGAPVPLGFVTLPDAHGALTVLDVFEDVSHCAGIPVGSQPPGAGEKVALAWVDAYGRVSPTSRPVVAR